MLEVERRFGTTWVERYALRCRDARGVVIRTLGISTPWRDVYASAVDALARGVHPHVWPGAATRHARAADGRRRAGGWADFSDARERIGMGLLIQEALARVPWVVLLLAAHDTDRALHLFRAYHARGGADFLAIGIRVRRSSWFVSCGPRAAQRCP